MFSKTIVIVFIALACVAQVVFADDCSSKFKQDSNHANVSEACVKTLNLNPEDMPKSEDEFVKTFDDKCFGKCFMTGMNFIAGDKFDHDAINKDIVDHITDDKVKDQVLAYTTKCLSDVEEAMKSSGGKITKDNECKLAAQFLYCTMKGEEKLQC